MKNKLVTIVIPAHNEAENLQPLLERIKQTMVNARLDYSVVIIDDHSTDITLQKAIEFSSSHPLTVLKKKVGAPRGKASALLSGFTFAKTDIIVMIDADLQYPPESIPEMVRKIQTGADVVVGNRKGHHASGSRRVASKVFRKVFGTYLHGFSCDIQSGLKAFRKEIIERVTITEKGWMFDLEFLILAREAGYIIDTVDISFDHRYAGKAKIGIGSASIEMALSAIKLKLRAKKPIEFHPTTEEKKGKGFHYKGVEFVTHTDLSHEESAFKRVNAKQLFFLFFLMGSLTAGILFAPYSTAVLFIGILTCVYFIDFLFNLFLIYRSFSKAPEVRIKENELKKAETRVWPKYTIFCPLYKEWEVLPQFVTAMSRLDYPKNKLQIMLLLEEDDKETIEHARALSLPEHFQIVVVPHSFPKTKPKASNYGLLKAKGEYVVIYDAEDVPDPLQLKKAVLAFEKVKSNVICIQAKLNFYNPHQNVLTRLFTAEYSLWFDLVLTGLQSVGAPIPLGGTSNHFRVADLKMLKGWDSFNVTEDCDLGMRLVKRGYKTAIIDSTTHEEANSDYVNWYHQRSRWIKGYIQTYLVHMRNPAEFISHWREPHAFTFQLVVGGKILALFINPFMWLLTLLYFTMRSTVGVAIESLYPAPIFYMAAFSLVFGNFLYMYYYMIGCAKREQFDLIKYAFVVPFYWLFMSIASWRALYQIFTKPHYWAKTKHGLHLGNKMAEKQAKNVVGKELVDSNMTNLRLGFQ